MEGADGQVWSHMLLFYFLVLALFLPYLIWWFLFDSSAPFFQDKQNWTLLGERRTRGKSAVVVVSSGGDGRREITTQAPGATTGPVPWTNRRSYPIKQPDWVKARVYFGDDGPFVMDAKQVGNLGRYFNHSCQPNIFAQSVFSSTHDPRFPDVAFFAIRC